MADQLMSIDHMKNRDQIEQRKGYFSSTMRHFIIPLYKITPPHCLHGFAPFSPFAPLTAAAD